VPYAFITKSKGMKKLYLLSISLFVFISLFAKDVDKDYAMQVAKNFYLQNTQGEVSDVTLNLVYECKANQNVGRVSDGSPIYYVFNVGNNQGFVIVTGDDLVQPVIGYSTESAYTLNNLPPQLSKWMEDVKKEVLYVKENVNETTENITEQWHNYYYNIAPSSERGANAVNPLLAVKWNQAPNENGLCPYDNQYNDRTVTGCVATAMAQIMKYWAYPAQGTGFHSYNSQSYGTLSANFGNTTYNWANMPNVLNSPNNDVATIMFHCGVAVEMSYGVSQTGGSGAYVAAALSPIQHCAEYAYKTYFGYDPATVTGAVRQNYTETNWINLLKGELDASRPIQYAGSGNGGGHTWVCDGYDNNNFMHMNWGWGGNSDGYFSVNNLDPSSLGAGGGTGGFNGSQHAVIGIKPLNGGGGGGGGGTVNPSGISLYSQIIVSANPVTVGSAFSVTTDIANNTGASFTGDFAAALFNSDGVFVDFIQEFTNQTMQSGFYYPATFSMASLDVVPGTYIVGIYYKNGGNNYTLIDPATYANPVSITVTGPYSDIQMYSNSTVNPNPVVKNQSLTVSTQIANYNANNFSGYLSADLFDMEGNFVTNIEELSGITLNAGMYYNVDFVNTGLNVDPGDYYVAFFYSLDGTNWNLVYSTSFPNPFTITIVEPGLSPDMYENNNTQANAYALTTNFTGNNAAAATPGSNMHIGNDYDYYKVNLPAGTNYSITARVHDSYNSGNGNNYTNDVQFSYVVNGGTASTPYDDVMPGPIFVQGGGTVNFFVADYFTGSTGSYLLDLQIVKGDNVSVEETELNKLSVFPNPAQDEVFVDAGELEGKYSIKIYNAIGEVMQEVTGTASAQLIKLDVSKLASGTYNLQLVSDKATNTTKLIVE
jgi:hypothetical protein